MLSLPVLPYPYDALEPYYGVETLRRHHQYHHAEYVTKLNDLLVGQDDLLDKSPEWILGNLEKVPKEIREKTKRNMGGHVNHSFFWKCMTPKILMLKFPVVDAIVNSFGNFEDFKKEFTEAAAGHYGSGWCWLIKDGENLEIITSKNHDNPITGGLKPLLVLDLYEHSYIYTYITDKKAYVESWWNIVNWAFVNENFLM